MMDGGSFSKMKQPKITEIDPLFPQREIEKMGIWQRDLLRSQ